MESSSAIQFYVVNPLLLYSISQIGIGPNFREFGTGSLQFERKPCHELASVGRLSGFLDRLRRGKGGFFSCHGPCPSRLPQSKCNRRSSRTGSVSSSSDFPQELTPGESMRSQAYSDRIGSQLSSQKILDFYPGDFSQSRNLRRSRFTPAREPPIHRLMRYPNLFRELRQAISRIE